MKLYPISSDKLTLTIAEMEYCHANWQSAPYLQIHKRAESS